jgi:hypothetical protein
MQPQSKPCHNMQYFSSIPTAQKINMYSWCINKWSFYYLPFLRMGNYNLLILGGWQPGFNSLVTVYHSGIRDFKPPSNRRLASYFGLGLTVLVLKKCKAWPVWQLPCKTAIHSLKMLNEAIKDWILLATRFTSCSQLKWKYGIVFKSFILYLITCSHFFLPHHCSPLCDGRNVHWHGTF